MNFQPANVSSLISFWIILGGVLWAFWLSVHRAWPERFKHVVIGSCVGLAVFCGIVGSGVIEAAPFPRLMILFGVVNGLALTGALSGLGRRIAFSSPLYILAGFQIFRFPLELVLHSWAIQGVIPWTMTWTGYNWDIISGLMAAVAWIFGRQNRFWIWVANVLGFVLLLNVMRVAIMSSPLPFAWGLQPPLLLGLHLPYALIVPVCVAGALAGHVILTRALLRK